MRTQALASTGGGPRLAEARELRDATRAVIMAQASLEPLRRPCGTTLTIPHAWALLELRASPGLSVLELADRLNIDASNVSRLCVRMESSGELRRETCPRDRRAKRLKLTAKGRKVAQRVDAASAKHFATVWKELGDAAPAAVDALEHVARALRAASGAAT